MVKYEQFTASVVLQNKDKSIQTNFVVQGTKVPGTSKEISAYISQLICEKIVGASEISEVEKLTAEIVKLNAYIAELKSPKVVTPVVEVDEPAKKYKSKKLDY